MRPEVALLRAEGPGQAGSDGLVLAAPPRAGQVLLASQAYTKSCTARQVPAILPDTVKIGPSLQVDLL